MTQQQPNQPVKLDEQSRRALLQGTSTSVVDTQSPLREFKGRLDKIEVDVMQGERGAYHQLTFKFSSLEVYRSVVNWMYPVADLKFSKTRDTINSGSPLGMLIQPIEDIWGPGHSLFELEGHELYINFTPGHPRRVNEPPGSRNWIDEETEAYEIIAIDGKRASGVAVDNYASASVASVNHQAPISGDDALLAKIGDGVTQAEFNKSVLADQEFQQEHNTEWNSVLSSSESVLQSLIARELVVKEGEGDQAVYRAV